jgi:hypothetical protein
MRQQLIVDLDFGCGQQLQWQPDGAICLSSAARREAASRCWKRETAGWRQRPAAGGRRRRRSGRGLRELRTPGSVQGLRCDRTTRRGLVVVDDDHEMR